MLHLFQKWFKVLLKCFMCLVSTDGSIEILYPLDLSDAPDDRAGLEFFFQQGDEMGLVAPPGRWLICMTMSLELITASISAGAVISSSSEK